MNVKRKELFDVLRNEQFYKLSTVKCVERLFVYIFNKFSVSELSEHCAKEIRRLLKMFVMTLFTKWRACHHIYGRFSNKHMEWLDKDLNIPQIRRAEVLSSAREDSNVKKRGRPRKLFGESSERTKQRNVQPIVSDVSLEKLCLATESSLVKTGKRTLAQVVKLAVTSTPRRLKKMKMVHDSSNSVAMTPYSPEEALALIVDLGLTKEDYLTMRLGAKKRMADIYPSYHVISETKRKCYPMNIKITENEAEYRCRTY